MQKELFEPLSDELIETVRQDQNNPKEMFVMVQGNVIEKEGEVAELPLELRKLSELILENAQLYMRKDEGSIIPVVVTEEVYQTL